MAKLNKTVIAALQNIQATGRVTQEVGKPLIEQGLIEVNTGDIDASGAAAARLTQKAVDGMPKQAATPVAGGAANQSQFAIITNATIPESKRGAGRVAGPSKYPFDSLPVGGSFFVPVSDDVPTPMKTMGSAVVNATNKHRIDTGQTKVVERTKKDAQGNKVKESVTVPVWDYPVKFTMRSVKKDQKLGEWVAPADGAMIFRVK